MSKREEVHKEHEFSPYATFIDPTQRRPVLVLNCFKCNTAMIYVYGDFTEADEGDCLDCVEG